MTWNEHSSQCIAVLMIELLLEPQDACTWRGVHLPVQCILYSILQNVKMTLRSSLLSHLMSVPGGSICLPNAFSYSILQNVKMTLRSSLLNHQMSIPGGPSVFFEPTCCFMLCFTEVFCTKDQWESNDVNLFSLFVLIKNPQPWKKCAMPYHKSDLFAVLTEILFKLPIHRLSLL